MRISHLIPRAELSARPRGFVSYLRGNGLPARTPDPRPQTVRALALQLAPIGHQRVARAIHDVDFQVVPAVLRDRCHVAQTLVSAGVEYRAGGEHVGKHVAGWEQAVSPGDR